MITFMPYLLFVCNVVSSGSDSVVNMANFTQSKVVLLITSLLVVIICLISEFFALIAYLIQNHIEFVKN